MPLDDRKLAILQAIIRNYLETGEPVGSRTISKFADLNLSSATIRNEMADLEDAGYIIQPHTSAGRIPSDRGYRLYVDTMMQEKVREVDELKEMLLEKADKMDNLLRQAARALAVNTNYASMVSSPNYRRNKLKFLQLSKVDHDQLLAVIVAQGNVIKNHIIPVAEAPTDETLLKLNILLNTHLNGLSIDEINLGMMQNLRDAAGSYSDIVGEVIEAVGEAIRHDEDLEIYTSGATNIFKYPELADQKRASELLGAFEEKRLLTELVQDEREDGGTGIQIYIGDENQQQSMRDLSVVTATYELEEGMRGTIGIIGPKRMDYEKVVGVMKSLKSQLEDVYRRK